MKPKISIILRVAVSVGLVGVLLWTMRGRFPEIKETLVKTSPMFFLLAVAVFIVNITIISTRLSVVLAGEELRIPFGRVVQLTFIGYFFNNFMPTAVGGDIVKTYYVYKQTRETAKSFVSVFMDRFIGLFSFIFLAAIALFISWSDIGIDVRLKQLVLLFAASCIVVFLVILNSRIAKLIMGALSKFKLWNLGEKLSRAYKAVHEYRSRKSLIVTAIVISLVSQSTYFTMVFILGKALGLDIALGAVFLIMPLVSVISMLPSLGGLGLREGSMVALFGAVVGSDNAFSLSILLLALLLVISLFGAVIYISASQFRIKEIKEAGWI